MPNSARPHVALGNLLSLKGQDGEGISEYQTALKLDPRNAGTYVLLGMAQKKGGHAELAEKAYRQALEIEPKQYSGAEQSGVDRDDDSGAGGRSSGLCEEGCGRRHRRWDKCWIPWGGPTT